MRPRLQQSWPGNELKTVRQWKELLVGRALM
jgi:hypothetical protein